MCPECGELLIGFALEGIEIDHCIQCGGTWLDAGELELIVQAAGADSAGLLEALRSAPSGERGKRRCPRCRRKMRIIPIGQESATPVDRCPAGHGFWLDRGEVQAVIASYRDKSLGKEPSVGGAVAQFFSELYKNEFKSSG